MEPTIVYIITKLELGGAQKVCLKLLEGLEADNQNVYLISGKEGILVEQVKNKKNIIFLDSLKREVKNPFAEIKNFFRLCKILKTVKQKHKNIIVHTHSTKAGLLGRWAAFFVRIKQRIHTVHGFGFHANQNPIGWLINYILELITCLITTQYICVSFNDQTIGKKLLPKFMKKSVVIRAAVDEQKFIAARKINENKEFIFGTIACFKKQKNLFDLLNCFKEVNKQNSSCKLEIIGDGALRPKIEAWIKENKLTNKINLLGWQENVASIMMNWKVFVLSSLWEGLPCAVVEARLLKLPIIAYDVGGIKEVVITNKNGILLRPKDSHGLSKAMATIINSNEAYNLLSNYQEDLSAFYANSMVNMHKELYFNQ